MIKHLLCTIYYVWYNVHFSSCSHMWHINFVDWLMVNAMAQSRGFHEFKQPKCVLCSFICHLNNIIQRHFWKLRQSSNGASYFLNLTQMELQSPISSLLSIVQLKRKLNSYLFSVDLNAAGLVPPLSARKGMILLCSIFNSLLQQVCSLFLVQLR